MSIVLALLRTSIPALAAPAATPAACSLLKALAGSLFAIGLSRRLLAAALGFFPNRLCFPARLFLLLRLRSANALKVRRIFLLFEKIGDIKKRVALQPEIDKRRLHSWQNARYTAFVNGTREGIFVFALVVDLCELIIFQNCKPRFMRRA